MAWDVGDTWQPEVTITDDGQPAAPATILLQVRNPLGILSTVGTTNPALGVYRGTVALTAAGAWVAIFTTTSPAQVESTQIFVDPAPATTVMFATVDELARRLGMVDASELSTGQVAQGTMLLRLMTSVIAQAVGRTEAWVTTLNPIPAIIRAVCLEAVARVMQNPSGARSKSETLGQWSHSTSYTDRGHGLLLTDAEMLLVRRAVWGTGSATTHPATTLDELIELAETGAIAP